MVVLSRIYTRTGDAGHTRLSDMSTTDKNDPRVAAYGDVDETNSQIGVVLATGVADTVAQALSEIQNDLFNLGADLSTPLMNEYRYPPVRMTKDDVQRLEKLCDEFGDPLPTLRSFILPGGTLAGAHLHVARTVCRRAERTAWAAVQRYGLESLDKQPGGVNIEAVKYLNRLSDLLFIFSRVVNGTESEVLWVPAYSPPPTGAPRPSEGQG